jgi:hypothetical protein
MHDEFEDQPWMKIGVAGNLLQEYGADQVAFFRMLAQLFESALPAETEIKHRGMFGGKTIESLRISLGGDVYSMTEKKGRVTAARTHVVRGIALKTEEIPVEEWLAEIETGLQNLAQKHEGAQRALREMLGLD